MGITNLKSDWVSGNLLFTEVGTGKGEFQIGAFVSAATGSGQVLSSTKTKALDVCADDGGVALTSSVRAGRSRLLITTATSGDQSAFGHQGQVKATASLVGTGNTAGLWGYFEANNAAIHIGGQVAGVYAMADLPTSADITTGGVLAALMCGSNTLAGTHNGVAAAIHIPNPVAGTWDFFAVLGSATGASAAGGAGTCTVAGGWVKLPVRVGATTYYIPAGVTLSNS